MMNNNKITIMAVSGSLRPKSSASAVLDKIRDLFPDGVDYKIFEGLAAIPAFDDSSPFPSAVAGFIHQVDDADAVLFCIPEYAFGVPGALKNALDWTVSTTAFSDKPVALVTAASDGKKAHEAMSLTLTALGTGLSDETRLLISSIRTKQNEQGEIVDPEVLAQLKQLMHSLLQKIPLSSLG
jgi:chromate reductase, NAD(P)H dehydrogenase (quinone)